jgi:hypothetical protein
MRKWSINITEERTITIEVEADDREQAFEKAEAQMEDRSEEITKMFSECDGANWEIDYLEEIC